MPKLPSRGRGARKGHRLRVRKTHCLQSVSQQSAEHARRKHGRGYQAHDRSLFSWCAVLARVVPQRHTLFYTVDGSKSGQENTKDGYPDIYIALNERNISIEVEEKQFYTVSGKPGRYDILQFGVKDEVVKSKCVFAIFLQYVQSM